MVGQAFHEIIVVDFDCPQGTSCWVRANHDGVTIVKVDNKPTFNLAMARNIGASRCSGDWLCFVDADVDLSSGFSQWLTENCSENNYYIADIARGDILGSAAGTVICTRNQFMTIGGYDEVITGWGGEDLDFYLRLEEAGFRRALFPRQLIKQVIPHDDLTRTRYLNTVNRKESALINKYYVTAKSKLSSISGVKNLPLDVRKQIYTQTVSSVGRRHNFHSLSQVGRSINLSASIPSADPAAAQISFSVSQSELITGSRFRANGKNKKRKKKSGVIKLRELIRKVVRLGQQ
jgi:glycosyltransferase involved in cell wall biosynthesis